MLKMISFYNYHIIINMYKPYANIKSGNMYKPNAYIKSGNTHFILNRYAYIKSINKAHCKKMWTKFVSRAPYKNKYEVNKNWYRHYHIGSFLLDWMDLYNKLNQIT